jgi:hypothetical protein
MDSGRAGNDPRMPAVPIVTFLVLLGICALLLLVAISFEGRSNDGPGEGEDGGGSDRRTPPGSPPTPIGGGDPAWWPEFERDFEAYVTRAGALA